MKIAIGMQPCFLLHLQQDVALHRDCKPHHLPCTLGMIIFGRWHAWEFVQMGLEGILEDV